MHGETVKLMYVLVFFFILYYDQQMYNYITNYHTHGFYASSYSI